MVAYRPSGNIRTGEPIPAASGAVSQDASNESDSSLHDMGFVAPKETRMFVALLQEE